MVLELTQALNRILEWHKPHNPQFADYLQPSLSINEIDNLAKDLPFQLPTELYTLYQWRNGSQQREYDCQDPDYQFAAIFDGWTFRPLQDVVKIYCTKFTNYSYGNCSKHEDNYHSCLKNFHLLSIFYCIHYTYDGKYWLNKRSGLSPIILTSFDEGELAIRRKYSSLTSMMLTLAEYYESGTYDLRPKYHFHNSWAELEAEINKNKSTLAFFYKVENKIWLKYNHELKEFAIQTLEEQSFSELTWIHIVYEIIQFKNSISCELFIKWLNELLDYYKQDDYRSTYIASLDSKLYQIDQDNFDYCPIETGLPKILGEIGDIKAVPILIRTLQDNTLFKESCYSRVCAAKSLGQLKDKRATISLIDVLQNDWTESRKAAIWALGEIGDNRAIEAVAKFTEDEDLTIRETAREALTKLRSP